MLRKNTLFVFFFVLEIFLYNISAQDGKPVVEELIKKGSLKEVTNDDNYYRNPEPIFTTVEQMPQYPAGTQELLRYIARNLIYPTDAVQQGIQGRVVVRFVVSKDGSIKDVKVFRSLDPSCDKEAVRVIKSMPNWIPGKQNGRDVSVYFTMHVDFRLIEEAPLQE